MTKIWSKWQKFDFSPPEKSQKLKISKIEAITILYHPKVYIKTKLQYQLTCRFLDPPYLMWKFTLSLQSEFWRYFFRANDHNIWPHYWKKKDKAIIYFKIREIHSFRDASLNILESFLWQIKKSNLDCSLFQNRKFTDWITTWFFYLYILRRWLSMIRKAWIMSTCFLFLSGYW